MFELSEDDLMLMKLMINSIWIDGQEKLIEAKNLEEIKEKLILDLDIETSNSIINEALYFINCFNIIHQSDDCFKTFENMDYGSNMSEDVILFVRLYQDLPNDQFSDLLHYSVDESLDGIELVKRFKSLEINLDNLKSDFKQKIIDWLLKNVPMLKQKYETICKGIPRRVTTGTQGLCLIINNENFEKSSQRKGTECDERNITETFSNLDYEIKIKKDVDHKKMCEIIQKIKFYFQKHHRKLVVFVLSHGTEKYILTVDEKAFKFKDLLALKNNNCENLKRKQKLFFFVCCRGFKDDRGVKIEYDSGVPEVEGDIAGDDPITGSEMQPECGGGFFIGYATYKGYRSYRNTLNGTQFIRSLCKIIKNDPRRDIVSIYQDVRTDVLNNSFSDHGKFQVPVYKDYLIKSCFLKED